MKYVDVYTSILASLFFIYHFFQGSLGLKSNFSYCNKIYQVDKDISAIKYENIVLQNKNKLFYNTIHPDYLETLILKHMYKVPKKAKIIKL